MIGSLPHILAEIWATWGQALFGALGVAGGVYGQRITAKTKKMEARVQAFHEVSQALANAVTREHILSDELLKIRKREWASMDVITEIYAQVISARLQVHDLEHKAGLPMTEFTPLSPYPFEEKITNADPTTPN